MVQVKIFGIAGSPRHGNTDLMVKRALESAQELGEVETDFVSVADLKIDGGCNVCYECLQNPNLEWACNQYRDDLNDVFKRMMAADGIIIGTPVYWGGISGQLKCLLDRCIMAEALGFVFRNKVGGALSIGIDRQGGQENALFDIHHWYFTQDMICVGVGPVRPLNGTGGYWGAMGVQGYPRPVLTKSTRGTTAVLDDYVGMQACDNLGKRVAEMAKIVKAGILNVTRKELNWAPHGGEGESYSEVLTLYRHDISGEERYENLYNRYFKARKDVEDLDKA